MIKRANVTVMVSDMDKSLGFYVDALGMKLKTRYGNEFAEIEALGINLAIHPTTKGRPKPARSAMSIGLAVDNMENTMKELEEKGIKLSSGMVQDGPIRLAMFKDPDGNELYLAETKWS
jgi:catechol 2,3-dioxygenase-like lactoylglutathione lyase family enzyme